MENPNTAPAVGINEALERIEAEDRQRWREDLTKARDTLLGAMRQYSGLVMGVGETAGLRGKMLDMFTGRAIDEVGLAAMDSGVDQVLHVGPVFPSENREQSRDLTFVPGQETYDKMNRKEQNFVAAGMHPKRLRYTDEMTQHMGSADAQRAYQNNMLREPAAFLHRQTPMGLAVPPMEKTLPEIPAAFQIQGQNDIIGRDEDALRRMYESASNDMSAVTARDEFERGLAEFRDVDTSILPEAPKPEPAPTPVKKVDRGSEIDALFPGMAPAGGSRAEQLDHELGGLLRNGGFLSGDYSL